MLERQSISALLLLLGLFASEVFSQSDCNFVFGSDMGHVGIFGNYTGQVCNQIPHGRGTMEYHGGQVYDGEWENGRRNGRGKLTFPSGNVYEGDFRNGSRHGTGTLALTGGGVYRGEWREDRRTGRGTYISGTGEVQDGIFLNGEYLGGTSSNAPFPDESDIPSPQIVERTAPSEPDNPKIPANNELLQAASGSGFAVSKEGHIITNNHVIEGCEDVRLHLNGTVVDAIVVSRDPLNDLAIIQADLTPAAVFRIDRSNPLLMQNIYVAGFPFGENLSSSLKVTRGIVSSLTGIGNNFSNMQIDAAIQPGNSGGPIFDESGNVIGVAVATLDVQAALEEFGTIPQNTNFGVKGSVVSNFLQSNGIQPADASEAVRSTTELGKLATDATYYLSCWMTTAQIQQMSSTKVMFQGLNQ